MLSAAPRLRVNFIDANPPPVPENSCLQGQELRLCAIYTFAFAMKPWIRFSTPDAISRQCDRYARLKR